MPSEFSYNSFLPPKMTQIGVETKIIFNKSANKSLCYLFQNGFGKVEPRDVNSYLIFKKDEVLTPGHTLKVPFVVKYEDPKQIPNISQVRLNARKVCENNLIPSTIPVTHDDVNGHAASKPVTEVKENVQEHKENVHNAPRH